MSARMSAPVCVPVVKRMPLPQLEPIPTHTPSATGITDAGTDVPPTSPIHADENNQIFVGIISYRDSECQPTIRDLYQQSSCPDDVYVGVVLQCDRDADGECFEVERGMDGMDLGQSTAESGSENGSNGLNNGSSGGKNGSESGSKETVKSMKDMKMWWKTHVRTVEMHYTQAKGPCWARHLVGGLWQGESFYLQVSVCVCVEGVCV